MALGTLVEEVLGFHLEKGHSAADWSVRPLREELLRYAALDVEVLIELRDALAAELADQGKTEWAREEFAAVLAARPAAARPDPWRRTSGIHRVQSRRGLAVVRELWTVRDRIAQAADLSPRRVLPDSAIIEAARSLPTSYPQLSRISGFAGRQARRPREGVAGGRHEGADQRRRRLARRRWRADTRRAATRASLGRA